MFNPNIWFVENLNGILQTVTDIISSKSIKAEVSCEAIDSPGVFSPGRVVKITPQGKNEQYSIGLDAHGTNLLITRDAKDDPKIWIVGRDLSELRTKLAVAIE